MYTKIPIYILSLLSLLVSMSSYAVTSVSGTITEDTVWTAANGPYRVVGSIKIAPGATLTIEGGATAYSSANELTFMSDLLKSHATHFDQTGKGPGITECNTCHNAKFKDNLPLETTTVCDSCHSPMGAFPGPMGAMDPDIGNKANFRSGGVYENDGVTLKPGKEKWCSTCHDSEPSMDDLDGFYPTYAPNVVGDNTSYGFWQTGHGKSIGNCLECHDAGKDHWDHNQRTYEIDESTDTVVNSWGDSYRLKTSSAKADENFCLTCHDLNQIRNVNEQSNFKQDATSNTSAHNSHIWGSIQYNAADSDYDNVNDSRPICTTCHNPHGSKSNKMTRTGELASTPFTDDRTPGLNQTYVKPAPGPFSTATWVANLPISGDYEVFAWWKTNGFLEDNAKYIINYNGGSATKTVKQRNNGNQWVSLGTYNFAAGSANSVVLSAELTMGRTMLADKIGFDMTGDGVPDIIVDDTDAGFSSTDLMNGGAEWPYHSGFAAHTLANIERFTLDVSLEESTAGWVRFTEGAINHSTADNHVCNNCHGTMLYERVPFLGPKIIERFEEKRWVANDGNGVADIVVSVVDPTGDMYGGSVSIDLSSLGGYVEYMTDNGDGTYSYQQPIAQGQADRSYELPVTAVDAAGNTGTGKVSVFVMDNPDEIILDNEDVINSHPNGWGRAQLRSDAYNGSYVVSSNGSSDITATWTPDVKSAGSYDVYVWLGGWSTCTDSASYDITHSGGTSTVYINQRVAPSGGGWVYLGTYDFDEGETTVVVSGDNIAFRNYLYVDALKLTPTP